jgi:MFS family permease
MPGARELEAKAVDQRRRWLSRGVASVGLASFFSDSGHEIATAVLPSFVTAVLRSTPGVLGVIEGVSDALTGVAKLLGGPLANDPRRRGDMARGGYLVTAAATGAIGLCTSVWQVGVLRATAWAARGIRSPARDSLLASLAPRAAYGRAFGLERAGDNMGAVAGPLLASALVAAFGIRTAIYFAVIPGVLAALAIMVAAREARSVSDGVVRRLRFNLAGLREAGLVRALTPVAMFELGNVATTLLILRATELLNGGGRSLAAATSLAILLYAGHNLVASLVAYGGGHWIDREGPRLPFAAAAGVYVAGYGLFAAGPGGWVWLLVGFLLAGTGIGLAETAESTLVARRLPDHLRGSGFGFLGGVQSFGDFASSAAAGLIWAAVSPTAAFVYVAAWMSLAAVATLALPPPPAAEAAPSEG